MLVGWLAAPAIVVASDIDDKKISICKCAIGNIMFRNPSIMDGVVENGIPHVYYIRSSDKTFWQYKCKIESGTVFWAKEDEKDWRYKEPILYEIHGNEISVYDTILKRTKIYPFIQ